MSDAIRVEEYEDFYTCGDGCCSNYDVVNVFHYGTNSYSYRGVDSFNNLKTFLEDVLDISFEYDYVINPNES
jgi:hypothetical protein